MTQNTADTAQMHIEVVRYYQSVWQSVFHNEAGCDDLTLSHANDYGNFSEIENLIERYLEKKPIEHHLALSLGCGVAKDLSKIGEFYPSGELIGIDTSLDALLIARNNLPNTNVNLICASASHLPFREDLKFDMLIAGHSLDLEFEENYLRRLLVEATKHSRMKAKFYMTFYGTDQVDLELNKCTPIGNILDELGWKIVHGILYCSDKTRFAEGVFWIAERAISPLR